MRIPDKLILKLNSKLPLEPESIDWDKKVITINIGPPVINATIDEIEDNPTLYYEILEQWLDMDKLNISRRSIGKVFSSGCIDWDSYRFVFEFLSRYDSRWT